MGGGVYDVYGTLNFYGKNTFINNSAISAGGGFYFEYGGNHTFVGNTTFAQNSAGRLGGGMYLEGSALFIDKEYTFIHNTADGGGAGMAVYNCILSLKGKGAFKNNHVKNSRVSVGGGIHTSYSELTFVGKNSFCNNTASIDSGGIYMLLGLRSRSKAKLHSMKTMPHTVVVEYLLIVALYLSWVKTFSPKIALKVTELGCMLWNQYSCNGICIS